MYLIYTLTLLLLIAILVLLWIEERKFRKNTTHGLASKFWMLKEKRRYVRFSEGLKIRYDISKKKPSLNPTQTKSANVSKKGLCLIAYEKLKNKDRLEIELELPDFSKTISLTGQVAWIKESDEYDDQGRRLFFAGIQFLKISPDHEALLLAHLGKLKRD